MKKNRLVSDAEKPCKIWVASAF